ncbi:nuclear transport factor 2 family protein [Chitinivorax sp. B]|uniref:nuclear transport factor 2 family protein n=1 Tax=Chitinivorax sp. B TaxID=2502235 RepID=UPI0010F7DC5C|nr:nuclear transport factor 2 family protein [Chitinivorax sp. B]
MQIVFELWRNIQNRDWVAAKLLLSPDVEMRWWSTGECFEGSDAVIHVNQVYPEGWTIIVQELNGLPDGRVHSLVRVDHAGHGVFYANSFFVLHKNLICRIDEYWSQLEEPPAWRRAQTLPGYRYLPEMRPDANC